MIRKKGKLARRLLLTIIAVSFFLVTGSFIYFYLSAESFLFNSAKNEIDNYYNSFLQVSELELKEYNNEIDGYLINIDFNNLEESMLSAVLGEYLKEKNSSIDEILVLDNRSDRANSLKSITVFGGELVLRKENISKDQFSKIYESLNSIIEFYNNSEFGFIPETDDASFFIAKRIESVSIILKLDMLAFFKGVVDRIYHPPSIDFTILSDENVFTYSTNIVWINQKWDKFFSAQAGLNIFFEDNHSDLICGIWWNEIFQGKLFITKNNGSIKEDFDSVILNLFIYSLIILTVILFFTILYTNRISKSLNEISRVTASVSKGNFEDKLEISRNDELGILIDSFNDMVENLKRSYRKLDITNKELKAKIDELMKTKSELTKQQKLALIGETISKISHEIQNKISGVSVWVQNLEMHAELDSSTKLFVQEIKNSLISFMQMLLNFKKFYRKPFLEKSSVNIESILNKCIDFYKSDVAAKSIKVEKQFTDNSEKISADKNLIEEVFTNLIVNAVYFCPSEGIIRIKTDWNNGSKSITISNEGPAIEIKNMENIFNPFYTTKNSGSGLGLAICKNIIDAHEGKISVQNLTPGGVQFTITLPRR